MEIFGIGPLEVALILLIVLIIFGPKEIEKTAKTIGKSLRKLVQSDSWRTVKQTGQELKDLPNRLMREANLEEIEQTIRGGSKKEPDESKPSTPPDKDA